MVFPSPPSGDDVTDAQKNHSHSPDELYEPRRSRGPPIDPTQPGLATHPLPPPFTCPRGAEAPLAGEEGETHGPRLSPRRISHRIFNSSSPFLPNRPLDCPSY